MTCPHCGAKLSMYEHYIKKHTDRYLIMIENYECYQCHQAEPKTRIATYYLVQEEILDD